MTETPSQRDERRAAVVLARLRLHHRPYWRFSKAMIDSAMNSLAASDAAAGMDYDALRVLVEDLSFYIKRSGGCPYQAATSIWECVEKHIGIEGCKTCALIARAEEVLDDKA